MNTPLKVLSFLAGTALYAASTLSAATTDPVGYVTVTVNANADLKVGVPLTQAPALSASVSSVVSGTVTTAATVPDVTTAAHYLWVTSGTLLGKWYEVTDYTTSSIVVAEDLQAAGLAASDTFKVVPFWTLDTLFPAGASIPQSSDVFNAVAFVLLGDPNALGTNIASGSSYLYSDGSQLGTLGLAEGWYDANNQFAGLKGDTPISPESYITIRNSTGSPANIVISGAVPVSTVANNVLSRSAGPQDNQLANPFPADIQLGNSDLVADGVIRASSDVFNPTDLLLIYPQSPTSQNPSSAVSYLYSDGSQLGTLGLAAGWYDANNQFAGLKDTDIIPAGSAIIVRRAVGTDELISWSPPEPYSL